MKKHQRYFPLEKDGRLIPRFIVFANGPRDDLSAIRAGNEHVLRARFADAAYFVRRDQEQPLEAFLPRLASLTYQAKLGSVLDKARRIERLTMALGDLLALGDRERKIASRAAHLAKADMASEMVIEMTSLQGEMGREYALRCGEDPEVAEAIFEHLLPRFPGDRIPEKRPGIVLGLADRLDSLIGLFAVGLQPTGASDPYALRRSAVGLIQVLVTHAIRIDLRKALRVAAEGIPVTVSEGTLADCLGFIVARHQALLLADGRKYDVVDAVLAAQGHDPAASARAAEDLEAWTKREDWPGILQAYARCARITRSVPIVASLDYGLFVEEAERRLHEALVAAEGAPGAIGSVNDFLSALVNLVPPITRFFDEVLVMAEDERIRANRLRLVQRVVDLADGVADLSKLEGF
jgi:glycyl-tRNA synthetase